jgi:hypothetical protein
MGGWRDEGMKEVNHVLGFFSANDFRNPPFAGHVSDVIQCQTETCPSLARLPHRQGLAFPLVGEPDTPPRDPPSHAKGWPIPALCSNHTHFQPNPENLRV